jgi:hypothetical protein
MDLGGRDAFGCFYFTKNLREGTECLKDFLFSFFVFFCNAFNIKLLWLLFHFLLKFFLDWMGSFLGGLELSSR